MTQFERWLMAWAALLDSLAGIFTFAAWRPSLSIHVTIWSLRRRCERIESGEGKEEADPS